MAFPKSNTHHSLFINYARKDYMDDHNLIIPNNIVSRVQNALRDTGIYWLDKNDYKHATPS